MPVAVTPHCVLDCMPLQNKLLLEQSTRLEDQVLELSPVKHSTADKESVKKSQLGSMLVSKWSVFLR